MLRLKRKDYEIILDYCKKSLPNEACGLIAGTRNDDEKIIEKVYLLKNSDESPEHFSMDVQEQFAAARDMRANHYRLLGNFHSHPNTPSYPSEEDKRLAYDTEVNYLILSLMDETKPVLKAFLMDKEKQVEEEEIKVVS